MTPPTQLRAPAPAALSLAVLLALATGGAAAQSRSFWAEGSDTGAGVGARYVAQGGTGVATSDDVHAAYYNPAGLAQVRGFELSVSRQLDARLHRVNFVGMAWRLPLPPRLGLDVAVAGAYYPRIHARASGAFDEGDFESIFLRYLLPGISGTFDGDIDTKTRSYRLAVGVKPSQGSRWSAGLYVERIDCRSDFCGVHATSNGFTTSSTGAKATGVGVGWRWQADERWTLAASLSDLDTRLTVHSVTTDDAGTRSSRTQAAFPRKLAFGAARRFGAGFVGAAEYEAMRGRYGSSEVDLQVLRLGAERKAGAWTWRAGAVVPVRIHSSATREIRPPFPLSPTAGLGWREGPLQVDLAVYAHPVMTIHEGAVSPAADLGVSLRF
jgi:hypothetical protein